MATIKPRLFKGARDFLPQDMIVREEILQTMRSVFQKYGFEPLETPAIEYLQVLSGKYGEDADRLIYRLNYKTGTKDEAALHYDLTVPFSRVIAMNPNLPMPFKRYQIQPVWRADRPQPRQGRFREFYQCDIDAVGSQSLITDAEIIAVCHEILMRLGFEGFVIKINNRKILNGLVQFVGLDASYTQEVCRSIDKLDKMPFENVANEMREKNIPQAAIDKLWEVMENKSENNDFDRFENLLKEVPVAQEGISEMRQLFKYLGTMGVLPENVKFDVSLARGLDYYTGPIFETVLPAHPHIGSLTGGGRYDTLIGMFSGKDLPAVGTSLGLDRIVTAMQQLDMIKTVGTRTKMLFVNFDDTNLQVLAAATRLRKAGFNAEVYPSSAKMKKQFSYADKKGIAYVIIMGGNEVEKQEASIKNMATGEQWSVKIGELATFFEEK